MERVEALKTIVKEELSCVCLVPEFIKFKGDTTAQGAAYYARYLEDERHEKISQVPRRWVVRDLSEEKKDERKSGVESPSDPKMAAN